MKLHQTRFFKEFTAVVTGLALAMASFTFITLPLVIDPAAVAQHLS